MDDKATLRRCLGTQRRQLLGTLDGLDEYDLRRPLTSSGTNLLGLVKHVASVQADYLGLVFDRPFPHAMPWLADDAEPDADLWVPAEQSRTEILALHDASAAHADATIDALPLDAPGLVPWWGDRRDVTLHQILVHLVAETARHAGHADILREMVDGRLGSGAGDPNVRARDAADWDAHVARIEEAARRAGG